MDNNTNSGKKMSTPMVIGLAIAGLVVIGVLIYLLQQGFLQQNNEERGETAAEEQNQPVAEEEPGLDTTGLVMEDVEEGDGQEVIPGNLIRVHYDGTLDDGTTFDSSRDRGEPFQFQIGVGQVIPGWDVGLEGMKVGGVRQLTVPPHLAYGEEGIPGVIPPNATLHFEVELLEIVEVKG